MAEQPKVRIVQKPLPGKTYQLVEFVSSDPQPAPAPTRDIEKETADAHRRLDIMIQEHPRWITLHTVQPLEDLVVHNEYEYKVLQHVREEIVANSTKALKSLDLVGKKKFLTLKR